jgi:hypothetical protein
MLSNLVVVVPSYGRPQNAWRLIEAFQDTCERDDTELIFVLDEGDETADDYPKPHLVSASRGMVPALNSAALHVAENLRPFAIGFMGDDHLPRTPGWDSEYIDALWEMSLGMVYGNDLIQGARIPTQVAMTSNIVRRLGWMAPPGFKHLFVDDAWKEIGLGLGALKYLPETIIEHLHPLGGTAENDENYDRVNSTEIAQHDQSEFTRWKAQDLPQILQNLRGIQ